MYEEVLLVACIGLSIIAVIALRILAHNYRHRAVVKELDDAKSDHLKHCLK